MKKLIVIADWAADSLNRQEFRSATEGFLKNPDGKAQINFVNATPSTIHTSFLLNQIVETEERFGRPQETVIFENTDPRLQTKEGVANAKGAEFVIVRLKSGIYVCGPNAGYDFSMVKERIEETFFYPNLNQGSQFRSRDLYSRVCSHLMDGMEDEMELEETNNNIIPELRGNYVGHIDNHGNIKTTISKEQFKGKYEMGETVKIKINAVEKSVRFVANLFGGTPGELVIYPGSSGNRDNPYLEISVWRHFTEAKPTTGLQELNYPKPGAGIIIL